MSKRPPPTLARIATEFVVLVLLQLGLSYALQHARVLEHLLSPGANSRIALGLTTAFLLLRMFVMLFAAGWLLARCWLWVTQAPRSLAK